MRERGSSDDGCDNASARLYEQPGFRNSAGRTLRPGGEALTLRGLELCGLVPVRPGRAPAVLDGGCGAGATLNLLQNLGFSLTGVDPSPDLLAEARAALGDTITLLPGTADRLPLADASQDGVVCECVLSLTPDPDAALADMTRVLRPGGALLLTDMYIRQDRPGQADGRSCLAGAMPLAAWRKLLVLHGLRISAEEDHSRALAELAARLIFSDSGLNLGAWLGPGRDGACGNRELARRLGYVLLAAVKERP